MLASSWWSVMPGPVDLGTIILVTLIIFHQYYCFNCYILERGRQGDPPAGHVRLRHVDGVDGGEALGPEQLQRLLPRHMLQLRLHLGLVLLVHSHRLLEDRGRLADRGHEVVLRVASLG